MTESFVLNVHDLDVAGKAFSAPIPAEWLARALADCDMGPAPGGPEGSVDVRFSRSGDDVVVNGRVRARIVSPCSRCLEPAEVPISAELALLFVPTSSPRAAALRRKASTGEEVEFTSEEADLEVFDGERIVLDPYVREAILLEVPPFPLCSESCPGIAPPPPVEGSEAPAEAIDPRLAPLLALRKRRDPSLSVPPEETSPVAVPKRKTTRSKSKMRRAQHDKVVAPNLSPCPNCSEFMVPHRVCPSCGFYKGAAVAPAPKA